MKILAVYPYLPWPLNRGAYHRAYHLLKGLAAEHTVDLLALAENSEGAEHAPLFEEFCDTVRVLPFQHPPWQRFFPGRLFNPLPATIAHWSSTSVAAEIQQLLSRNDYDALHVLDLVLSQFFLKENAHLPLVLDRTRVDLQYQLMEQKRMNFSLKTRLLNCESFAKLWAFEKAVSRRCAFQVVCGPDDHDFVRKHINHSLPLEVIPNGVDLDYFDPAALSDNRASEPTVIFCGAMDYNPNIDALRWFFSEIHHELIRKVPNLRVLIVGKDPVPEVQALSARPGVTVTGGVPDVRPYYKRAWLQIVPLRIGGGTRLKIVESLSMGTPVVSTTIGAQGLNLQHESDILFADSAPDFVHQTARALNDAALRHTLERNGSTTARERLSWSRLGRDLSQAYTKHLTKRPGASERVASPEPAFN